MLKLEIYADTLAQLVKQIEKDLGCDVIFHDLDTATSVAAAKGTLVPPAPSQPEPTPLEEAIAATQPETTGAGHDSRKEAAREAVTNPPKGRGRPRKAQTPEAPAGALTGGLSPSVPASQPAVENTGSDSLPPSPSVGDVAVESPVAAAPVAATVGADAKTMRNALQDLSARIGGNDGLDAVADVIGKFGFNKVSQITPDQHDAIIAAAAAYEKD